MRLTRNLVFLAFGTIPALVMPQPHIVFSLAYAGKLEPACDDKPEKQPVTDCGNFTMKLVCI